ncbi:MAG TPA: glycine cleavage system protein GcvH [Gammaproteobacteria bacterium]|nr:glycine cleavage system protein GcvH [Gammaproteobacteria bacterium]
MSNIPADLKYTKSHEWVKLNADGTATIGITDHAQDQLGDMVYVEAPDAGRSLKAGEACAVVESVKAASDVYAPVAGEVIEGNAGLADAPESVNHDPYGSGWLLKMKLTDAAAVNGLMDAAAYAAFVAAEEH